MLPVKTPSSVKCIKDFRQTEQYKDLHLQYEKKGISASYITDFKHMDKPAMAKKNTISAFGISKNDINHRSWYCFAMTHA